MLTDILAVSHEHELNECSSPSSNIPVPRMDIELLILHQHINIAYIELSVDSKVYECDTATKCIF